MFKTKTSLKRMLSVTLALAMSASMTTVFPVTAEENTLRIYSGDGYEVSYSVKGSWDGNQNIEVSLTNTGSESLLNWALKYDAHGEIGGLWNGTVYDSDSTKYIVKNAGYNYEIQPEQTVTFGYTLSGEELDFPETIELCSQRTERSGGYNVTMDITDDWDTGFSGTVTVENTGEEPLEAWRLSFDTNFTIDNIWNAQIVSSEGNRYTFVNDVTTTPIGIGERKAFGFTASKQSGVVPAISDFAMSEITINGDFTTVDIPGDEEEDIFVYAFGEYNEDENAIDIEWYSNADDGCEYEVSESVDNIEYTSVIEVSDFTTYRYHIDEDFDTKYFKVKVTSSDKTAESVPFAVNRTDDGYSVDFLDSDGDGLADIYEDIIGTDINSLDTDGDGLTDYQEVYITGTDPTKYDSVTEGVSDSDADNDSDGLSNGTELELGTDPMAPDSDSDGLNDGEEVNVYGTDPLNPDTDGDTLHDGDEPHIGLDPTNPQTFGTPDEEYVTEQTISADSEVLAEINTAENPYELTIKYTGTGYAEGNLSAGESGYANAIQSDAVLGKCVEISYESTCKIEECVLYYKTKDNYTENVSGEYAAYTNELDGIKRLQVFRFYEDMNVLLPVETEYDVEKDTVICNADLPGTYCLLDMELWLESIGFVVEEPQNMIMSLYTDRPTTNEFINANMTKVEYNGHTYGIYSGNMEYNWDSAEEICESLGGHLVTITNEDEQVFIEKNLLKEGTNNSYWIGGQLTTNGWKWQTGEDFSAYTKWTSGQPDNCLGQEDKLMMYRNTNPLCTSGRFGYWNDLNNSGTCKGESFFGLENFGFICEWENPHITEYILIFGHTLKKVYLNDSLSPNNSADTDKDGLLDWAEVKSEYAAVDENGRVHFLKLVDFVKMGYDILGWKRLENSLPGLEEYLNLIEIVPCNSDPTVEDTDGDGLLDGKVIMNGSDIIAPIDLDPLKYTGTEGLWKRYISEMKNNRAATSLGDWSLVDMVDETIQAADFSFAVEQIAFQLTAPLPAKAYREYLLYDKLKKFGIKETFIDIVSNDLFTPIGSTLLMMRKDNKGIAYHSQTSADLSEFFSKYTDIMLDIDTWQKFFGYNDFYDSVFKFGTNNNMDNDKFYFTNEDTNTAVDENTAKYVLWIWRGNYLNLGSGAEMGIYQKYEEQDIPDNIAMVGEGAKRFLSDNGHWFSVDFELPMTLSLYNYNKDDKDNPYDTIFNWNPENPQWWITGFNPDFKNPDYKKMIMIGTVDFSEDENMYKTMKATAEKELSADSNSKYKYLLFDDESRKIWIMWGE
jgi:hypothetical protein